MSEHDTAAHVAKATGAFNVNQKAPPLHGARAPEEPHTGVRKKAPPAEPPTRPDVPQPNLAPAPAVPPSKSDDPVISDAIQRLGGKLSVENVRGLITIECRELEKLLHEKNRKYGNSALDPKRVFSKASPVEQIAVRLDDKLSRIATTGFEAADEDTVQDLLGYLILFRVARRLNLG